MEEIKANLRRLLSESSTAKALFRRNILKEYLQIVVLDFIYSHPAYASLVFYGGTCLAQCYGLPRLSEDLDFVDIKNEIDLHVLAEDLGRYFNEKTDLTGVVAVQKFRVHLKFPVLRELGLASRDESDFLMLKVEVFRDDGRLRDCPQEIVPLFKMNRSILARTFDLPTLMATKIRAVLLRRWTRTDKSGTVIATVKGRDYFDLLWYLRQGVVPNLACIKEMKNMAELKRELLLAVEKVDPASIKADLGAFIADDRYIDTLSSNLREILAKEIARLSEPIIPTPGS